MREKTFRQRSAVHQIATTLATLEQVRGKDGKEVLFAIDAFVVNGMVQYAHATPSLTRSADVVQCSKPAPYEYKITSRFLEMISMLAAAEKLVHFTDDLVPFRSTTVTANLSFLFCYRLLQEAHAKRSDKAILIGISGLSLGSCLVIYAIDIMNFSVSEITQSQASVPLPVTLPTPRLHAPRNSEGTSCPSTNLWHHHHRMSTYGDDAARSDLTNSLTGIRCPYPDVSPSYSDHEPVRGSPQVNSGSLAKSQALPETTCAVCSSLRRRGVFVGPELPRPWITDSHALHPVPPETCECHWTSEC